MCVQPRVQIAVISAPRTDRITDYEKTPGIIEAAKFEPKIKEGQPFGLVGGGARLT